MEWLRAGNGHPLPVLRSQNLPGAIEHNRETGRALQGAPEPPARLTRTMAWKIGVDGGGPRPSASSWTRTGRSPPGTRGPGCSPSLVGAARAREIAAAALEELRAAHPSARISATLLCMAGSRSFWKEFGEGLAGFGALSTVDDSVPVLELATRGGAWARAPRRDRLVRRRADAGRRRPLCRGDRVEVRGRGERLRPGPARDRARPPGAAGMGATVGPGRACARAHGQLDGRRGRGILLRGPRDEQRRGGAGARCPPPRRAG